ncbi:MAG: preprotein translocase subunit YajC [Hyphomicrobiales bacterium]|jgi:preprotein translocase subunit YajC
MFVTPAYAQAAGAAGGGSLVMTFLPFIFIFVIMWFLIIRPQRQQMKRHKEMIANVRRNDTIVTSGGIIGKVTKVLDDEANEIEVQVSDGVKIRVVRSMIQDVRAKAEPVAAND